MKCFGWIIQQTDACKVDDELLEQSSLARLGERIVELAVLIRAVEPVLVLIVTGLLMSLAFVQPAFAQTPGGNVFGGNDQTLGNGVREAIKWGRNLLFLLGIVFVGWGIVNFGSDKPAAKQIVAAIGCFAFGGIVALVYSISQGNAVNLDTGFGN